MGWRKLTVRDGDMARCHLLRKTVRIRLEWCRSRLWSPNSVELLKFSLIFFRILDLFSS